MYWRPCLHFSKRGNQRRCAATALAERGIARGDARIPSRRLSLRSGRHLPCSTAARGAPPRCPKSARRAAALHLPRRQRQRKRDDETTQADDCDTDRLSSLSLSLSLSLALLSLLRPRHLPPSSRPDLCTLPAWSTQRCGTTAPRRPCSCTRSVRRTLREKSQEGRTRRKAAELLSQTAKGEKERGRRFYTTAPSLTLQEKRQTIGRAQRQKKDNRGPAHLLCPSFLFSLARSLALSDARQHALARTQIPTLQGEKKEGSWTHGQTR